MAMPKVLKVHGLDLSYFTGKLEGYLRGKQIPYELIEMDTGDFKRCGKATGVAQMPQVEWQNGQWLSDTTLIIEFLEQLKPETSVMPQNPTLRFVAQLLKIVCTEFLPYMQANEEAIANERSKFEFTSKGIQFKLPTQRYRAWRFQRLRTRYQVLDTSSQHEINTCFPELGTALNKPVTSPIQARIADLPITTPSTMTSRTW